jgi:hypothetical protein
MYRTLLQTTILVDIICVCDCYLYEVKIRNIYFVLAFLHIVLIPDYQYTMYIANLRKRYLISVI